MNISIVIPVYNEKDNLRQFYLQLKNSLEKLTKNYEIIFINDASDDGCYELLYALKEQESKVEVLNLPQRKGQLYALMQGIKTAEGEVIITLDCDLQYDSSEIKKFVKKIQEGYDAVGGVRKARKDSFLRKLLSKIANILIRALTGIRIYDLGCSFNAFDKKIYDKIKSKYGQDTLITKPLVAKFSRNFIEIEVTHFPREKGESKTNLPALFILFMANVLSATSFLPNLGFCVIKGVIRLKM